MISTAEHLTQKYYTSDVRNAKNLGVPIVDARFVDSCLDLGILGEAADFLIWKDNQVVELGDTKQLVMKKRVSEKKGKFRQTILLYLHEFGGGVAGIPSGGGQNRMNIVP